MNFQCGKTNSKEQFIYGIKSGDYIKIGISNNVFKRFEAIQTCTPLDSDVVFYAYHRHGGSTMESFMHETLSEMGRRKKLEWFKFKGDELDILKSKYPDAIIYDALESQRSAINSLHKRSSKFFSIKDDEALEALNLVSRGFA